MLTHLWEDHEAPYVFGRTILELLSVNGFLDKLLILFSPSTASNLSSFQLFMPVLTGKPGEISREKSINSMISTFLIELQAILTALQDQLINKEAYNLNGIRGILMSFNSRTSVAFQNLSEKERNSLGATTRMGITQYGKVDNINFKGRTIFRFEEFWTQKDSFKDTVNDS